MNWDEEFDVVVVGSGAAGMSSAIVAVSEGMSAIVLEREGLLGGGTAVSGGVIWIPGNRQMQEGPSPEKREDIENYMRSTTRGRGNPQVAETFVNRGREALDYLEGHSHLRFSARPLSPDYDQSAPGARTGWRAMDPDPYDGSQLGPNLALLKRPLSQFTLFGGPMVAKQDFAHLLNATRSVVSALYCAKLLARHVIQVIRYGRGTRLTLGNALAARLIRSLADKNVPFRTNSRVTDLIVVGQRVAGVTINTNNGTLKIGARRGVVLACGGFPGNQSLRDRLLPISTKSEWSAAPQSNQGDGLVMAERVGGTIDKDSGNGAFWAPASTFIRADGSRDRFVHLLLDRAKPGFIAVGPNGKRFVNEASSYHHFVEGMIRAGHSHVYLIGDAKAVGKYGIGRVLPGGWGMRRHINSGYLVRAHSLTDLAARLSIDGPALTDTVERYNHDADEGHDTEHHKGVSAYDQYMGDPTHKPNPCIAPLRRGPFYAVKLVAGDIGTAVGLHVDGNARVLQENGTAIQGLYACGNDMSSINGGTYFGSGATLGPALVFGYVAAMHMKQQATLG